MSPKLKRGKLNPRLRFGLIVGCALLLLPSRLPAQGVALETRKSGDVTARLEVQVADREPGGGKATVWYRLTVEGPAGLEVEPARLDDPTSAWKPYRWLSWASDGTRTVWGESIRMDQLKPGVVPLPDVTVRFRDSPAGTWEEAEWKDILKTPREIPDIEPVPPAPPAPSWKRWLQWSALAAAVLLAAAWLLRRRLAARPAPLPPDRWALRELDRIERTALPPAGEPDAFHTQVSNVVRRYLQERFGLRAPQQTTAELLALGAAQQLPAAQQALLRDLFERCDLAKFARAGASPEDCRRTATLARAFVQQTATRELPTTPRPRENVS
jgi:hypothetical protein